MFRRVNSRPHLKLLYKCFLYCGLLHFKYNRSTHRMVYNKTLYRISRVALEMLFLLGVVFLLILISSCICRYFNWLSGPAEWTGIVAQEKILLNSSYISGSIGALMIVRNYVTQGHKILPAINEMLEIHELLRRKSTAKVFFSFHFGVILVFKIGLCFVRFLFYVAESIFKHNLVAPLTGTVAILTYFAHFHTQLVLICFYYKMNRFLKIKPGIMNREKLTRHVHELLAISIRIHHVRRKVNKYFSALFLGTYLGVFADIYRLYKILKIALHRKLLKSGIGKIGELIALMNFNIPLILSVSYDIYLIGRLSDMLRQAEKKFEQRILVLMCGDQIEMSSTLDFEVEQLIFRNKLYDLKSQASKTIKIDQRFAFNFITNVILVIVISCLQYYASERVYQRGSSVNGA